MASTNSPGVARNSAVAASTGRLNPSTDPKALTGSPSKARRVASARSPAEAAPHGFVCLITTAAASGSARAIARAASRSIRLLYDSSLPCELARRDQVRAVGVRSLIDGRFLMRVLAVPQDRFAFQRQVDRSGEMRDSAAWVAK